MPDSTHGGSTAPRQHLTIDDVATAAGFSVATVSRALRGLPNVTPSTRTHIQAVADRLGYHADPAAARLAAGRTRTVTVAVPSLNGWYFSTVVAGAEAMCAQAGLDFQVVAVSTPEQRDRLLADSGRLERRTDGLVLVDITIDDRQAESITSRGIALATVGTAVGGHPSVRIDDVGVGRLAAEHLIGLGHERIAVLGGHPESPLCFDVPAFRWQGFSSAMSDAGLAVPAGPDANGGFTIDGGYEAMISILARRELPTAVFAMSDEMAFGALIACNEHSIVVGADLSIIGVDDHEFSRVVELTTISQPVADHGSHAARLLIARIEGDQQLAVAAGVSSAPDPVGSSSICPEVHLVERSTTGRVHVGAGGENVPRT